MKNYLKGNFSLIVNTTGPSQHIIKYQIFFKNVSNDSYLRLENSYNAFLFYTRKEQNLHVLTKFLYYIVAFSDDA